MSELFLTVLNMSLTAGYVIIFVILIRLLLKKAPKVISYALWGVAAFRLIIPFSFESMFSLMPRNTNVVPIPHDIIYQQSPQVNSGIGVVDSLINNSLPVPTVGASANPLQIYVEIGAYIWVLGIIALLVYSFVSTLILKRQLKSSQLIEQNIFEAKNLKTPFVLGLIKPKIYLPVGLNATERSYILLHEQTHIHRKDHMIKVLAFLTLSVHWFNPLVWIAFILMSKDMELSCDERVLKEMNEDIKKPYANSLLSLASGKHILNGSPLAFGEGNLKGRIKNVLNYKRPRFWIIVFSIVIVTIVGIGLMADPKAAPSDKSIINNTNDVPKITVKTQQGNDSNLKTTEDKHQIIDIINYFNSLDLKKTTKDVGRYNGMSYIITIYYSNGTSVEYVHFGNKFFKESGGDWYEIPYNQAKEFENIYNALSSSFKKPEQNKDANFDTQISSEVESKLDIIMSSPKTSSNPQDYINAHKNEYEYFFKYGGEDALQYMLTQFEVGNVEGLRGQIMMQLCKELLGSRNNVTDDSLSPQEWYDALSIRQEVILPNYEYDGQDTIEKLVYDTEIEMDSASNKRGGFIIVAPKVFGSYEEEDSLKVFVTTYSARYKLFGSTLSKEGGSIIPAAITYRKDDTGRYILEKYEQARDGSEFGPSIREYCTMPISGKEIKGLADKIFKHYTDYDDIRTMLYENLYKHLKKSGITDVTLTNSRGEVEFYMGDPKYKP